MKPLKITGGGYHITQPIAKGMNWLLMQIFQVIEVAYTL